MMSSWREKSTGYKLSCIAVVVLIGLPLSYELIQDFSSARVMAHRTGCRANLKQFSAALFRYAEKHKNHLPDAEHWREAVRPYLKPDESLVCPDTKIGDGYAMEQRLSKIDLNTLENPAETILIYETDAPDQKLCPSFTETRLHDRSDALLTASESAARK